MLDIATFKFVSTRILHNSAFSSRVNHNSNCIMRISKGRTTQQQIVNTQWESKNIAISFYGLVCNAVRLGSFYINIPRESKQIAGWTFAVNSKHVFVQIVQY